MIERPPATTLSRGLADQWYQELWKRDADLETLKALARLRVSRGVFSRAVQQAILVKRPDSLRIDSMSSFGDLIHQIIWHEGTLTLNNLKAGRVQTSDDAKTLLADVLGIDIDPTVVVDFLLGRVPLENRDDYLGVQRGDHYILRGLSSQVVLNSETQLPIRYMNKEAEHGEYEAVFDDYRKVGDIMFPFKMTLVIPSAGIALVVEYKQVALNETIPNKKFTD